MGDLIRRRARQLVPRAVTLDREIVNPLGLDTLQVCQSSSNP
jgi:hypothetical protein